MVRWHTDILYWISIGSHLKTNSVIWSYIQGVLKKVNYFKGAQYPSKKHSYKSESKNA